MPTLVLVGLHSCILSLQSLSGVPSANIRRVHGASITGISSSIHAGLGRAACEKVGWRSDSGTSRSVKMLNQGAELKHDAASGLFGQGAIIYSWTEWGVSQTDGEPPADLVAAILLQFGGMCRRVSRDDCELYMAHFHLRIHNAMHRGRMMDPIVHRMASRQPTCRLRCTLVEEYTA